MVYCLEWSYLHHKRFKLHTLSDLSCIPEVMSSVVTLLMAQLWFFERVFSWYSNFELLYEVMVEEL